MAAINVTGIVVLDNPAPFANPFQFEVSFECLTPIPDDIEWKLVYVGSAESDEHDQELASILVGPMQVSLPHLSSARIAGASVAGVFSCARARASRVRRRLARRRLARRRAAPTHRGTCSRTLASHRRMHIRLCSRRTRQTRGASHRTTS